MPSKLAPSRVDPSTAGEDFWKRYHEFRRVRQKQQDPDDPLRDDPAEEARMKRVNPFEAQERFEMSRDGVMVSWFYGSTVKPESPEYATSKHLYEADIFVRREQRRQRIGASWLPLLVERMDSHGCTTVGFWTQEKAGNEFMRWVGAEPKLRSIESRLRFSEIRWSTVEQWDAEGPKRSPQTTVELRDGHAPESEWADLTRQLSALLNTIPFEAMDHGEIVITPETLRDFYARLDFGGERQLTVVAREPNGLISGLTDVLWAPYRPTIIHQQFTGVRPEARGRGVGKWIKAAMLLWLRDLYPETQWIVTDNAGSNAPMLKINRTLGFKPHREGAEYQMTRDQLASRRNAR